MAPPKGRKRPNITLVIRNSKRSNVANSQNAENVVGDIVIESQQNEEAQSIPVQSNINHGQIARNNGHSGSSTLSNLANSQPPPIQLSQLINQNPLSTLFNTADVLALHAQNQQLQALLAEQQRQLQPLLSTLNEASSSRSTLSENVRTSDSIRTYLNVRTAFQALVDFTNDPTDKKAISAADFIKLCKDLYSRIHPNEHENFFVVVKSKITGQARSLISEAIDTISNVDELMTLLSSTFIAPVDFDVSREALRSIKQENNETIHQYGSTVSDKLAKALNIARQNVPQIELAGHLAILKSDAINGFISGLKDKFVRKLLLDRKPKTLQEAMQRARDNDEVPSQSNGNHGKSFGTIGRASVNAISIQTK